MRCQRAWIAVALALGLGACHASGSADGAPGEGVVDARVTGEGPLPDSPGGDGPGPDAAGPRVWSVAADRFELDTSRELAIVAHPKQPQTVAVARSPDHNGAITVVTTSDLGQTLHSATIKQVAGTSGGYSFGLRGFGYDPGDGTRLVALFYFKPDGGAAQHLFARSQDGGKSFAPGALKPAIAPYPPDMIRFAGGAPSELAARARDVVYLSKDLGATFPTKYAHGSACPHRGNFAVSPADHGVQLLVCGPKQIMRCAQGSCSAAALPTSCDKIHVVEFAPHDAKLAVADACSRFLYSKDGGKTFKQGLYSSALIGGVTFRYDPRPGRQDVYALLQIKHRLFHSPDGGASWTEITPAVPLPPALQPPTLRDFDIAADGAVIGLASPGLIRYPAP